jgi:methylase of polypeptide subunit release factors
MTADREDNPLALDVPDEVRRLREALDGGGYTPAGIAGALNAQAGEFRLTAMCTPGKDRVLALARTAGDTPLNVLIRLFMLGATVDLAAARAALAPSSPEALTAVGLLEACDGGVRAVLQLSPLEHLRLVADPMWASDIHPKHVVSAGGPSIDLARMTVRRPVRRTLDMGTGCGVQAFLAAAHSESVVGVDRNPRAVNVAAFNAQLNGLTNCRFVTGDLYAPVRDQRFDLIVANPPYVLSPGSKFLYRDSGLKGDEIAQRVIREGAALLDDGGLLQLTCEWAHLRGTDWRQRMAGWFADTGCDVCVLQFTTVTSEEHARLWLRSDPHVTADALPDRLRAWTDYHKAEGIEAVSDGVISLRKRAGGPNWLNVATAPQRVGPCGPAVERLFAATDFLSAAQADDALLAARVRLNPEVRWEQKLQPTPDGWDVWHSQLYVGSGLVNRTDASRHGMTLLELCDGRRTVGELLAELTTATGQELPVPRVLGTVRQLVEQGFLLPAG